MLKAALLDGSEALDAWRRWKSSVDIATIDYGSFRMLPLLYRNLTDHGIADFSLQRLKGVYRQAWYKNQLLFHGLSSLLRNFQQAGVETIILKGTALVLLHYKDYGLRPMEDFDILVRTKDIPRAVPLLEGLGWRSIWNIPVDLLTGFRHSCNYEHVNGGRFDLHWFAMLEWCHPEADREFWSAAVPLEVNGVPTRALCPTDQLLHVCLHGVRWDETPPFRWVADAMMIMRTAPIDWGRLYRLASERRVVLPMRHALHFLRELVHAPVPTDVLKKLDRAHPTFVESVDYTARIQPLEQTGPFVAFLSNYMAYLRMRSHSGAFSQLVGLPKFLQTYWHVPRFWQLPFYMVFKGVRRIGKMLVWHSKRPTASLLNSS